MADLKIVVGALLDQAQAKQDLTAQLKKIQNLKIQVAIESDAHDVLKTIKSINQQIVNTYKASEQAQTKVAQAESKRRTEIRKQEIAQAKALSSKLSKSQKTQITAKSNIGTLEQFTSNEQLTSSQSAGVQSALVAAQTLETKYKELLNVLSTPNIDYPTIEKASLEVRNLQKTFTQTVNSIKREAAFILDSKQWDEFSKGVQDAQNKLSQFRSTSSRQVFFDNYEQYAKLLNAEIPDPTALKAWEKEFAKLEKAAQKTSAEITKTANLKTQLSSMINSNLGTLGQFSNNTAIADSQSKSVQKALNDVRTLESQYRKLYDELDSPLTSQNGIEEIATELQDLQKTFTETVSKIRSSTKFLTNEDAWQKFQADIEAAKAKLEVFKKQNSALSGDKELSAQFNSLKNSLNSIPDPSALQVWNRQYSAFTNQVKAAGKATQSFTDTLKNNVSKFTQWFTIGGAVATTSRSIKEMFEQVKSLDSSLTELRKVSDLTGSSLENFTNKAFNLGSEIGRTGQEVIDATTTFKRAGYTLDESLDLAEAALVMTNVGDNIGDTADAASYLISVLKGFNMNDTDAMKVVDMINETSNNAAIDFDNIAEGLRRVSSTMSQTGTSLGQTIGLLTGGFGQLRDIEMVSSGLVMISQRLRGIDEEGEAIDGLAPKLQAAFKEYANIDIQDQNGELRSTYDILSDLAEVYPSLTTKERQYLGELAAGNRQVKVLNSIVTNWEDVEQAVAAASDSVGSAEQENAAFMDSIQGRLNELNSTFQEFSANTIDDGFVKSLINAGIGILDLTDRLGGLQTILIAVGGILTAKYGAKAAAGIADFFTNIGNSISAFRANLKAGKNEGLGFFDSLASAAGTTKAGLAIGAVTTGLTILSAAISAAKQAEEERRQAAIQAGDEAKAQSNQIFELATQYMSLSEAVKTDTSAKSELLEVQKELIDNLGAEKAGIDGVTQSLQQQTVEQLKANHATLLASAEAKKQNALDTANRFQYKYFNPSQSDINDVQDILSSNNINVDYLKTVGKQALPGSASTIDGVIERAQKLKQVILEISDSLGAKQAAENSIFQFLTDELNALTPVISEYQSSLDAVNESAAQIEVTSSLAGGNLPETQGQFDSLRQSIIETAEDSGQFIGSQEDITAAIDNVLATMPGFSEYMGEAGTSMEELGTTAEEAGQSLDDIANKVNSFSEVLANFAENGAFSADDLSSLIELDPNLEDDVYRYIAGLQSADELVKAIKESSKEAESLYRENVLNKLWPDIAEQKQIVSTMAQLYSLDAKNYATIEEAKAAIKAQIESQKWLTTSATASDFVNLYLADFQNYAGFEQAKTQITAGVLAQIQGLNAAQIAQIGSQYGVDLSNFTNIEKQKPEVAAAIASKLIQTYGVVSKAQRESLQSSLSSLQAQRQQLLSSYNPNLIGPQLGVDITKIQELDKQISDIKAVLASSATYDSNSFLSQLDSILGNINVQIPQTNNLIKDAQKAAEDAGKAAQDAGNAAADAAQKALDKLEEMNDELQDSLDTLNEDRQNIEALLDDVMAMLKQRYDDEIERLDELIDKQEEQRDKEIEAIEAETKAYMDKIDAQLESLRAKEDERKFNEELEEKSKDLADLQAELLAIQLDDSDYGKKKRLELEEEIAEKTKELNDFQHEHEMDLREDALEQEKENAESALDEKKDALEQEYQLVIDNYEQQRDALQAYLDDEWNLRQEAYRLINKGGKELYDDLIEYNRHYGNAVDADVRQKWDKAYSSLKKYNDGQIDVRSTLEKISSSATTLQKKIDALAPKIDNARKKADSLRSSISGSSSSLSNAISKADSLTNSLYRASNAAASIRVPTHTKQWGILDTDSGDFIATGYKSYSEAASALRQSGAGNRYRIASYAKGRVDGQEEWALVDERGSEIITRQKGRITYLEDGDGVIPHDITKTLMSLGTNPSKYMMSALGGMIRSIGAQSAVVNNPVSVEYGDIVIQGNANQQAVDSIKDVLSKNGDLIAKVVYDATRKSAMKQGFSF